MKVCIFVDGENFRHSIVDIFSDSLFSQDDYLPKNARWADFFDYLVNDSVKNKSVLMHPVRVRTYWYAISTVDSWPYLPTEWKEQDDPQKINEWRKTNENHINKHFKSHKDLNTTEIIAELRRRKRRIENRFSGFQSIHRVIANKYDAIEFKHSGAISHNLFTGKLGKEKTVDVNLAVDMLQLRDIYDMAIIVSGDQDYLPVVQAVKNAGKTVVNVAFAARSGILLPGGAKRLNESTDWSLTVNYDTLANYMGLIKKKAE